jgi:hypothetical protein
MPRRGQEPAVAEFKLLQTLRSLVEAVTVIKKLFCRAYSLGGTEKEVV